MNRLCKLVRKEKQTTFPPSSDIEKTTKNMKRTNILIAFLCAILLPFLGSSQSSIHPKPLVEWERNYGGGRTDRLFKVIENIQGGFAAVGMSKSKSFGKSDMFLLITNENGRRILNKRFGRKGDDAATSIIQTHDGGYAVVGYTESEGSGFNGQRDAVILKMDEKGKTLWARFHGTPGFDEFNDILQLPDENFLVTGQKNSYLWLAKINNTGDIIWEHTLQGFPSAGYGIALTEKNEVVATGQVQISRKIENTAAVIVKADLNGNVFWVNNYEDSGALKGSRIIVLNNGDLAVTGQALSRVYRKDMLLLITNANGTVKVARSYGGKSEDGGNGIAQAYNGDLYLVGFSRAREDRKDWGWVNRVNSSTGERVWGKKNDRDNFLGGKLIDRLQAVTIASDGSVILAGSTTRLGKNDDGWILKLTSEGLPNTLLAPTVDQSEMQFFDEDENGILSAGERGYLAFYMTNTATQPIYNLQARITKTGAMPGIKVYPVARVGRILPGERKFIALPITSQEDIDIGKHKIVVDFLEANNAIIPSMTYDLKSEKEPQPKLMVQNPMFEVVDGGPAMRGKRLRLTVDVKNEGTKVAQSTRILFEVPDFVTASTSKRFNVGHVPIGGTKTVSFEFIPQYSYFPEVVPIVVRGLESTSFHGDEQTYSTSLRPALDMNTIIYDRESQTLSADWAGLSSQNTVKVREEQFGVKLNIGAGAAMKINQFIANVNNQPIALKANYLKQVDVDESKVPYGYQLDLPLQLQPGVNQLSVKINSSIGKEITTKNFSVEYDPVKPVLHLLSIGVPLEDVKKFSPQDALDFAQSFSGLSGNFFDTIRTTVIHERRDAFTLPLRKSFKELRDRFLEGDIKEEDVLIVFISSHGTNNTPGTFKIKAADFDGFFEDLTTIDYEEVIEKYLQPITCKKLLVIDAFNEVIIEDYDEEEDEPIADVPDLSGSLIEIMKNLSGLPAVLASSINEASYEDAKWANGAFARALEEAFTNMSAEVDTNNNQVITVNELYAFLSKRVPQITSDKQKQNPYFMEQSNGADFEIFRVRN